MDSTVIAASLPAIASDIGTQPIALKLALTAYFVSLAIFWTGSNAFVFADIKDKNAGQANVISQVSAQLIAGHGGGEH